MNGCVALNGDMDEFKTVLMDLVRAAGAQIRPLVKPEAVLKLQEAIDDLKRRTAGAYTRPLLSSI
jgi:hypothetical protein